MSAASSPAHLARPAGSPSARRILLGRSAGPLVLALLAAAALLYVATLTLSSLYIDEVFSWQAAYGSLHQLFHAVRVDEVAPPTYYLGLHVWALDLLHSDSPLALRLPSAAAGVGLVGSLIWFTWRLQGPRAALLAGVLGVLSPLLLRYGQEARSYIWAMLAVTLAAASALELEHRAHRRTRWVGMLALAAVLAVWLNYTAWPLVVAIVAWASVRAVRGRERAVLILAVGAAALALVPLASDQLSRGHWVGIAPGAGLTVNNLTRVLATPFDGRFDTGHPVAVIAVIGGAVLLLAASIWAWRRRVAHVGLLLVLTWLGPILALAQTLVSHDVLITRYTAMSAPFGLALLAVALCAIGSPRARLAGVAGALTVGALGMAASLAPSGHYPDLDGVFARVAAGWRAGDVIVLSGYTTLGAGPNYYLPRHPQTVAAPVYNLSTSPELRGVVAARTHRLWLVLDDPGADHFVAALPTVRYDARRQWRLPGNPAQRVVLAAPQRF